MIGMNQQIEQFGRQLALSVAKITQASQNIANVNTPNYKATEVASFSEVLGDQASMSYSVRQKAGLETRRDGNNVDIDQEIGQLKKNSLNHRIYTQLMAAKIRQLRSAVAGQS